MSAEEARAALAPGATLTQITAPEGLTDAWQGDDGSYVLYAEDKGYEYSTKPLNVAVGFDANGAITGVWVDVSGQTAGIGDQAASATTWASTPASPMRPVWMAWIPSPAPPSPPAA